ncbi:MAG TPA: DUF4350 domain-containing protein [Coriobacteriia bacterium]|jgi:hypothetical protein
MRRFRLDRTTVVTIAAAVLLVAAYASTVWLANRYYVVSAPASSVYSASPQGFKVYYTYLKELGVDTRILQTYDDLPKGTTIVAAAPFDKAPVPAEATALGRWVRNGGRLVAVGGDAGQLLERMGFGGSPISAEPSATLHPLFPGVYADGIDGIRPGPDRLLLDQSAWVAHFKDFGGQVLVSRKVGAGEVVWLAGPWPLTNAGIGEAGNGRLALELATVGGRPVYFDEYHHGYVRQPGFWDRLGAGGRSASLLLGAALAIALLGWSRRIGPPILASEEPEARRGTYIAQLAQLYRKAGARAEALATLEDGLARALMRSRGTLEAGLAHFPQARQALDASRALRERGDAGEKEFVETARALARSRQEVERGNG